MGEVGATIAIVVKDATHSVTGPATTVLGDGTWSVSGIDVSTFDGGTITYQVTAEDAAHYATVVSMTATKDGLSITSVTNPIGLAHQASVTVAGKGEPVATITLIADTLACGGVVEEDELLWRCCGGFSGRNRHLNAERRTLNAELIRKRGWEMIV